MYKMLYSTYVCTCVYCTHWYFTLPGHEVLHHSNHSHQEKRKRYCYTGVRQPKTMVKPVMSYKRGANMGPYVDRGVVYNIYVAYYICMYVCMYVCTYVCILSWKQ